MENLKKEEILAMINDLYKMGAHKIKIGPVEVVFGSAFQEGIDIDKLPTKSSAEEKEEYERLLYWSSNS